MGTTINSQKNTEEENFIETWQADIITACSDMAYCAVDELREMSNFEICVRIKKDKELFKELSDKGLLNCGRCPVSGRVINPVLLEQKLIIPLNLKNSTFRQLLSEHFPKPYHSNQTDKAPTEYVIVNGYFRKNFFRRALHFILSILYWSVIILILLIPFVISYFLIMPDGFSTFILFVAVALLLLVFSFKVTLNMLRKRLVQQKENV